MQRANSAASDRTKAAIEFDREADGRWIAELRGVLAYGDTKEDAMREAVRRYLDGVIDIDDLRERIAIAHECLNSMDLSAKRLTLGADGRLGEHLSGRWTEVEFRRFLVELLKV